MLAIPVLKLHGIQRILTLSKSYKDFSNILNLESMLEYCCKVATKSEGKCQLHEVPVCIVSLNVLERYIWHG